LQQGTIEEIFRSPKDRFVAEFTRSRNMLRVEDLPEALRAGLPRGDGARTAVVRPEDVVVRRPGVGPPGPGVLKGRVTETLNRHPLVWIAIETGRGVPIWAITLARELEDGGLAEGAEVEVVVPKEKIILL
jgi:ABC-type Fe3+/spermidine/putrescine transport system ATPase subunit